jgi:two-component system OmpR family sensor kinase
MPKLSLSLLLVVVLAIFGLGILLDILFERYNAKPIDSLSQLASFGEGFASVLNSAENPEKIIANWPDSENIKIGLERKDDLPLPSQLKLDFELGKAVVLESEQGIYHYYYLNNHDKVLALHSNTESFNDKKGIAWAYTAAFYLGTLALVLLWLKPLLYRLTLLRNTTKAFGAGQLESRVQTGGVTYIRDIEQDFNRMADQIQQLVEDNKLLTSAVSHDLRTPLARLRFGIDTLNETTSAQARELYYSRINNDLNEMEALVDSLLRYARLDNVMSGIKKTPVELRDLVAECVAQHHDAEIAIDIDVAQISQDDSLMIPGCIEHLATLLNNLIHNAIQHAKNHLLILMYRDHDRIVISFCDDGKGIPKNQRDQVLKPFQRGTDSLSEGYGLGLAVAARIAKYHGGYIEIDSCESLGGALIKVRL